MRHRHRRCEDCQPVAPSRAARDRGHPLSRRGFLGLSLGGALGLALGGPRRALADEEPSGRPALPGYGRAQACIVLWLNGGPSQLETFDPKPGTAQGGPTRAIATTRPGVQLCELLPRLAEQMDHVSLVRSMSTREGNHARARYLLHTGYVPSGTVQHPDLGSLVCNYLGDPELDLPSFVAIGGATPGAGILGVANAPFTIQDATQPVQNLAYPAGVDAERFARRRSLRELLGRAFAGTHPGPETSGHEAVYAKADRMMHSERIAAFEVGREPEAMRSAYGLNPFGQGCLMARRLIETGVKVVEVQLNGWDTHQDNFNRTRALCETLDAGFATLVRDLRERDLLARTLVVCMGEFGRTPRINQNEGRDHFARAWSLALAGGPIQGGRVVGSTSPDGMEVAERPVTAQDLLATVFHAVGVDGETVNYTPEGRPIQVVDASGRVVSELLAG